MIEPLQDAYVDYLGGLLLQSDVDLPIVKDTLALLGFNKDTIDDILGENLHICSTSSSSVYSEPSRRSLSQSLTIGSGEPLVGEQSRKKKGLWRQQKGEQRIPHDVLTEEVHEEPHVCSVPTLSASSISESTCLPSSEPVSPYHKLTEVNSERERLLVSSGALWGKAITTPERRARYREHLHALEELLGVGWTPTAGNENKGIDSVPLEVRSFVCRNRLQKMLRKSNKMEKTFLLQAKEDRKVRRPLQPLNPPKVPKVQVRVHSRGGRRNNDLMHLGTRKPPRSPQSEKRVHVSEYQRQCELCTSLEYGLLSRYSEIRSLQPQYTAAAVGNACCVKMQPRAVNWVGSGRITRKALATTLPQRKDRVKMALAYRDEWKAVGFFA